MSTTMSSVKGNHMMNLFYLSKQTFKNLVFHSLITGKSFKNLLYLSSCWMSQRRRFKRIRSNVLRGIESDLAYIKVSKVVSQYILQSGSLWYPLSSRYDCTTWYIINYGTQLNFISVEYLIKDVVFWERVSSSCKKIDLFSL